MSTFLKTSPAALEIERRRKRLLRLVNRQIIREEKRRGCQLCGKRLPNHLLHFHHHEGAKKWKKISSMTAVATPALVAEMSLCRLWCKAAHDRFHATGEVKICDHGFALRKGGEV